MSDNKSDLTNSYNFFPVDTFRPESHQGVAYSGSYYTVGGGHWQLQGRGNDKPNTRTLDKIMRRNSVNYIKYNVYIIDIGPMVKS